MLDHPGDEVVLDGLEVADAVLEDRGGDLDDLCAGIMDLRTSWAVWTPPVMAKSVWTAARKNGDPMQAQQQLILGAELEAGEPRELRGRNRAGRNG